MSRLDTTYTVETPEGVEFELHPAGPVTRLAAGGLDFVLRGTVYLVLFPLLGCLLGAAGFGLCAIVFFVLEWGYPILFEMYNDGTTPGKGLLDLQVVHPDGTSIQWSGSVLRNLLRVADFLPFGYAAGIVSMVVNGRFQRLGDLAGETVVCYRRGEQHPSLADLPDAEPVKSSRRLTAEERAAVVEFTERSAGWSEARTREIASIPEPLTGTRDGEEASRWLHGLARSILSGHGSD